MTDELRTPDDGDDKKRDLLTDREAAERMGWHWQKIQRLRLAGKLPFYPGRPPLIEPADLDRLKVRRGPEEKMASSRLVSRPVVAEREAVEQRARQAWLRSRYKFPK